MARVYTVSNLDEDGWALVTEGDIVDVSADVEWVRRSEHEAELDQKQVFIAALRTVIEETGGCSCSKCSDRRSQVLRQTCGE